MTMALAHKDIGDDLDALWPPDDERERLEHILGPYYQATLEAINTILRGIFDQVIDPTTMVVTDAAVNRVLAQAATRVVRIDEATRAALRAELQLGQLRGYSTWQVAHGVPADGYRGIDGLFQETWRNRALTVARTELQHASVVASRDRFAASGVVDRVRIIDGDDWDRVCADRNGTEVPLEQAPDLAHPNCLVGGQVVWAPNRQAGSARWYDGEVIVLRTTADDLLTVTPNHPILTTAGWRAAGDIREGDCIVRSRDPKRIAALVDPDHQHRPAMIEQVTNSPWPARHCASATVPLSAEAFHGDAVGGDICVIWTDGSAEARTRESVREPSIGSTDSMSAGFARHSPALESLRRVTLATTRMVSRVCVGGTLVGIESSIAQLPRFTQRSGRPTALCPCREETRSIDPFGLLEHDDRFASEISLIERPEMTVMPHLLAGSGRANFPPEPMESFAEYFGIDPDLSADGRKGMSGLVEPTRVCEVVRCPFRGHVYNLQTAQGWYIASNLITHNCTLSLIPLLREGVE